MNITTEKTNALLKEILNWCVDNHDQDKFCVMIRLSGHVCKFAAELYSGAWDDNIKKLDIDMVTYGFECNEDDGEDFAECEKYTLERMQSAFDEMKEFKSWHDENQTPEAISAAKEKKRLNDIARLKVQLQALEDHS